MAKTFIHIMCKIDLLQTERKGNRVEAERERRKRKVNRVEAERETKGETEKGKQVGSSERERATKGERKGEME